MTDPSYVPDLWTYRYAPDEPVAPYGDDTTYRDGLGWLWENSWIVEDWGAGAAYGRKFTPLGGIYVAIDGSPESAPYVDHVCDLRAYEPATSQPDGIFLRHVLEHNLDWQVILDRALLRCRKRLALVVFTPFSDGPTRRLRPEGDYRHDLSFNYAELTRSFDRGGFDWRVEDYCNRPSLQYGEEHMFKVQYRKG